MTSSPGSRPSAQARTAGRGGGTTAVTALWLDGRVADPEIDRFDLAGYLRRVGIVAPEPRLHVRRTAGQHPGVGFAAVSSDQHADNRTPSDAPRREVRGVRRVPAKGCAIGDHPRRTSSALRRRLPEGVEGRSPWSPRMPSERTSLGGKAATSCPALRMAGRSAWCRGEADSSSRRQSGRRVAPLRVHDLRHTAVALWIAAGATTREIANRAGHTSVSVVLDRYGHLLPGAGTKVNDALDRMAEAATGASTRGQRRARIAQVGRHHVRIVRENSDPPDPIEWSLLPTIRTTSPSSPAR